jgi:aspartate aminotransferase
LDYAPEQIVINCGGKHTLYNLAQVLFCEGDQVLIPAPYWVSYPPIVTLAGAEPVIVKTEQAADFKMTPADLEKAITPKTRGLILNSPSNPTGSVYTRDELAALGEIILKHDLTVISDDIYEKILYDGRTFVNMANISPELKEKTIIAHGLAKTYAMTGWRIGFMAGPKNVAQMVTRLQSQSTSNPCSIAQKAAAAALNGPEDDVARMRQAFDERRKYVVDALNQIDGVSCFMPGGAFYVFPSITPYLGKEHDGGAINTSDDLAEYLLTQVEIALVPGSAFGQDDCVRLSYAVSLDENKKGLDRMADGLAKLK